MRRLIYIIGVVLSLFLTSFPMVGLAQVHVRWKPLPEQQIGTVNEDQGVILRHFTAVNTGDDSWQVLRSYTSCGCTTVKITQDQVVRPGDSTHVEVAFDPKGKSGPFREVATIQLSDGEKTFNEKLTLVGEVRRSKESLKKQFPGEVGNIRFSASKLDFGETNCNTATLRHLVLCNTSDRPQQVKVAFSSPLLSLEGQPTAFSLAPDETLDLPIRWNGKQETRWGRAKETLTLSLGSGQKAEVQLLTVILPEVDRNSTVAPVLQVERRIALSQPDAHEKVVQRISLQNVGNATLQVLRVYSEQPEVAVKSSFPIKIEPGKTQEIEVEISPSTAKDFPITLISTDVKRPRQTLRIYKK